jgi:hypothetical protein
VLSNREKRGLQDFTSKQTEFGLGFRVSQPISDGRSGPFTDRPMTLTEYENETAMLKHCCATEAVEWLRLESP